MIVYTEEVPPTLRSRRALLLRSKPNGRESVLSFQDTRRNGSAAAEPTGARAG